MSKLIEFTVEGLLGRFNHRVTFPPDWPYVIIYGPNGVGKTKLLQVVAAVFRNRHATIAALPFTSASFSFEDGATLKVIRDPQGAATGLEKDSPPSGILEYRLRLSEGREEHVGRVSLPSLSPAVLHRLEREFPVEQVGQEEWYDQAIGDILISSEVVQRYDVDLVSDQDVPREIRHFLSSHPAHLIETQRLLSSVSVRPGARYPGPRTRSTVRRFSEDLVRRLRGGQASNAQEEPSAAEDIASRVRLLQETINSRLMFKRMEIDTERGFRFWSDEGREIDALNLSAGEQHQLVVLYELLFIVQREALVLIDEPEISLHVAWQQQFLTDMSRIAGLRELRFIVATQSPQIIHKSWNHAVDLQPLHPSS